MLFGRRDAESDYDEPPMPISIGGKAVFSYEDCVYLGEELVPRFDGEAETFKPGEYQAARDWVIGHYSTCSGDDKALRILEAALEGATEAG